jgi:hypothetical protein
MVRNTDRDAWMSDDAHKVEISQEKETIMNK